MPRAQGCLWHGRGTGEGIWAMKHCRNGSHRAMQDGSYFCLKGLWRLEGVPGAGRETLTLEMFYA